MLSGSKEGQDAFGEVASHPHGVWYGQERLSDPQVRAQARENLRQFIKQIDVDVTDNSYTIRLNNTDDYVRVVLTKSGHYIMARAQGAKPKPSAEQADEGHKTGA
jgi:hypothetical protein